MSVTTAETGVSMKLPVIQSPCRRCLSPRVQEQYLLLVKSLQRPETTSEDLNELTEKLKTSGVVCIDPNKRNGVICTRQELQVAAELANLASQYTPGSRPAINLAYSIATLSTTPQQARKRGSLFQDIVNTSL